MCVRPGRQFYYIRYSQKARALQQSRFALLVVLVGVLGPRCTVHLTVSLIFCRSRSHPHDKSRAVKGPFQLKKPFEGLRQRQGSCWEERKRIVLSLICLKGQINDFFTKRKEKKLSYWPNLAFNRDVIPMTWPIWE